MVVGFLFDNWSLQVDKVGFLFDNEVYKLIK